MYNSAESTTRLFADDCVPYRRIKTDEYAKALQLDLDALQRWEKDWLMEFHPQKCQIIHVTSKRSPIRQPYTIYGHTLEEVDSAKYLGINIHKTLKWNYNIDIHSPSLPKENEIVVLITLVRPSHGIRRSHLGPLNTGQHTEAGDGAAQISMKCLL